MTTDKKLIAADGSTTVGALKRPVSVASTLVMPQGEDPAPVPDQTAVAMDELRRHYRAILDARGIHYPVAYQLLEELGRGRQGVVFLGLRQGARGCITRHAIKVMDPELYRSPQEYWRDMGRIASQLTQLQVLQSPNLVSRHSYEETYGIGYVQMDAIDGLDLTRLLNPENLQVAKQRTGPDDWGRLCGRLFVFDPDSPARLRPEVVVYVLRRVLRGLERLHEMNFLHYDVKPGNIMIDRLGTVKVVDFGRAVMVGEEVSFLLGSPLYMAPETHERRTGSIATDLYSVGLLGLELLRGKPMLDVSVIDEARLLGVKMELPARLDSLLPDDVRRNEPLVRIIQRLIDPDPQKRFRDAKEAESGDDGLVVIDHQMVQSGADTQLARDLSEYLSSLVDPKTQRVTLL